MIEGNQLEKVINVGASDDGNLSYVTLQLAGAGNVRLVVPKEQASTLLSGGGRKIRSARLFASRRIAGQDLCRWCGDPLGRPAQSVSAH